ncbi:ATP-dependent (S)-NAD(P)H-hydrate dehydratase [Smittium culicis]|uniref:ATP-dependent (S)-NAD(P)H-hydrate dehydratase n=1 Tax=Smittium culicis TaxID=133412 RepID=A0A1R1XF64_9FUNG|nr:ATP-dependent (S)-NAD(P)H-hydrate dehydratase [Smittium culicis]OMJ25983.1 ATP-dependent (S)-NAD(P)H-hydrate dehydratase [Smittium culicis]
MKSLNIPTSGDSFKDVENLANKLGNVTVVLKGQSDIISNGKLTILCSDQGGLKRCGGQGDILCGAIATFFGFGVCYLQNRWE